MTQPSNIRKLLTDSHLGLLPYLDKRLKEIEKSFDQEQENLRLESYDLEFGDCNTQAANEPRPIITQSILMRFALSGVAKDKFELLLLASELQNTVDAAIYEWSNREWHQFEKPLKRPVTQIVGCLEYEVLEEKTKSCRIAIYRNFDLSYSLSF